MLYNTENQKIRAVDVFRGSHWTPVRSLGAFCPVVDRPAMEGDFWQIFKAFFIRFSLQTYEDSTVPGQHSLKS